MPKAKQECKRNDPPTIKQVTAAKMFLQGMETETKDWDEELLVDFHEFCRMAKVKQKSPELALLVDLIIANREQAVQLSLDEDDSIIPVKEEEEEEEEK